MIREIERKGVPEIARPLVGESALRQGADLAAGAQLRDRASRRSGLSRRRIHTMRMPRARRR